MLPFHRMSGRSEGRLAGTSILVVEDEASLRWVLRRLLANAGACVCEAADGDEAIEIAATTQVDLILTDMDLPGRDGRAVALAITAMHPRVAVVFMSGRPRECHSDRLAPDDQLVEKPFGTEFLVETLASALASARA